MDFDKCSLIKEERKGMKAIDAKITFHPPQADQCLNIRLADQPSNKYIGRQNASFFISGNYLI